MKNYKQILEAINKGIQLALDDFEDNEPIGSTSQYNDIIDSEDIIKHKVDLMKEVVDLGLPSGTLWCKYNLGSGDYGRCYRWGDIIPTEFYSEEVFDGYEDYLWNNRYKFARGRHQINKYCTDLKYGGWKFRDNLTELQPEDDAATQNMHLYNFKFHIPTKEQCEELLKYTTVKYIDDVIILTGNNNKLYFVKNPYINYMCTWTSSLDTNNNNNAYVLAFSSDIKVDLEDRVMPHHIRPVINVNDI